MMKPYEDLPVGLEMFLNENGQTLLDIDFINLSKNFADLFLIKIENEDRKEILKIVEREANFLKENNLMDYSILIGIEQIKKKKLNIQGSVQSKSSKP